MKLHCVHFVCQRLLVFSFLCLLFCAVPHNAKAQPQLTFTPLIQNLDLPINIKNAGDSSGTIYIVEQTGKVKIYRNGVV